MRFVMSDEFPNLGVHVGSECSPLSKKDRNMLRIVEEYKTNLMSLAILFHFLCAQHVSDINISIIRRLRLFC